ncbi:formate dehydrogenase [Bordetella genomosp. 1]|uniref:Formate dehydrogenase n=1 Tax=Bordetella genomosp. 1 TaxID=1395607 RepID=A0A261RXW9_9BORD|nr:formate dehydrogenase subunit delta [Bordetella genomosp. 1]OZI29113.1 formate dehydrogenase [Bordetella genomosp. 1]OZI65150.1 formate dehydrogenase [Bordetella genomosp. 1]
MDPVNLIRMANRIGDYFDAYPDQAEAIEGVANHIQKFWEPRMRTELLSWLAAHPDGQGAVPLHPLVLRAVQADTGRFATRVATSA